MNEMRPLIWALCVAFTFGGLHAQTNVWQPSPGHTQVPIWPEAVDNVNNSLGYYIALKNAKVSAEMHLYAEGGHAYGLRRTKFPITEWPELWRSGSEQSG